MQWTRRYPWLRLLRLKLHKGTQVFGVPELPTHQCDCVQNRPGVSEEEKGTRARAAEKKNTRVGNVEQKPPSQHPTLLLVVLLSLLRRCSGDGADVGWGGGGSEWGRDDQGG
jgi:hypothetical protein